ncbi:MAG: type II secretion system protein N [Phenylobacterium sp.]|uniref:type II secretion system protein N n=1 Tax=Phenylobacterium sp. TaxID=1871053 RepID=UPI00391B544B
MNFLGFPNIGARGVRRLVTGLEAGLVIVLAVQAARIAWILLAPPGPIGQAPPPAPEAKGAADLAILARFDPFFRADAGGAAPPAGATAAQDAGGLRLFGVRADGSGSGSAIIRTSAGREASFAVGEEVEPGLVLREVADDHVILARGGARQRLEFAQFASTFAPAAPVAAAAGAAAAPQPPAGAAGQAVPAQQLLSAAALSPRMKDGREQGYRVTPRGAAGADILARAGLQPNDVILSIDGEGFNAERAQDLPDTLAKSEWVDLRVERGGQTITTRVRIAPR